MTMPSRRPLLLVSLVLMTGRAAVAQDTARVDPLVITATRAPLTRGALPVAVTVLDGNDLRARGIASVGDALREVTSAYVAQSGSHGATTSLFLRGGESKYVKVLVDGVPTNDPGGVYDFASLSTDNVERIEVVRGPASVVHGADAVTGVVHVITRRGAGASRADMDLRMGVAPRHRIAARDPGTMRTLDGTVAVSGGTTAGSYTLSLGRHGSTGLYDINNEYQNNVLSSGFAFAPGAGTDVRLSLRYNDYRFRYPTDGGGVPVDTNAVRVEDRIVIGAEVERVLPRGARAVLSLSSSVNEGGTTDDLDQAGGSSFFSQDRTRRRGAGLLVHGAAGTRTLLTGGVQLEQQDQRSQLQGESPFGPYSDRFEASRRNLGVHGEATMSPTADLTVTAGLRLDRNQRFGEFATGRVGASLRPARGTRLRITAGNAFREPSFFENYATGFVTGNPGLRPERVLAFDGGIDQELLEGRASVSLSGFLQRFRDMIDYTGGTTACGYSYCNVAEATANGVELETAARLVGRVHAAVGATFLKTTVVQPGFDTTPSGAYRVGQPLLRRPERNVNATLEYRGRSLTASARLLAVGIREDKDFRAFPATPVVLPSYERVDLTAEYRLPVARATAVSVRIENLANAGYQHVFNFLTPRRTVSLGVRTAFD